MGEPIITDAMMVAQSASIDEALQRLKRTALSIKAENEMLRATLRSIISHWDEFGPEFGMDEVIDGARRAMP